MNGDPDKQQQFVNHAMTDIKGGYMMLMAHLGDRLGLFEALARRPMDSRELAETLGLDAHYVAEWLAAMACGGYLEYTPETRTFSLPPEHATVLADSESPVFFGGIYQQMKGLWDVMPALRDRFSRGGGVDLGAYGQDWWDGMERLTATWAENFLLEEWIPQAELEGRLVDGARVADIGCGKGRALVRLAQAFPKITGVGYDLSDSNLEGARRLAAETGVDDRIRFEKHDIHDGLPESFDLIMTLDAAHDFRDPARAIKLIHRALRDDGAYLLLEYRVGENLEDNMGLIGAVFYSVSVTYCMTTSLALGGQGLGTCGMPESRVRAMTERAGFTQCRTLPFEHPLNKVYVARK